MSAAISVLIGGKGTKDPFTDLVAEIISTEFGDRYTFTLRGAKHSEKIMGYFATETIDIFIPFVNCIIFPRGNMPPSVRIECALAFIAQLRQSYSTRVIAVSGVDLRETLLLSGIEHFFTVPFQAECFALACRACLVSRGDAQKSSSIQVYPPSGKN